MADYAVGGMIFFGVASAHAAHSLVGHTIKCCETLKHKEPPMRYHVGLANLL